MQKDVNRFIVPQAVPEIYRKNERLKTGGMCFFVIDCILGFPNGIAHLYRELENDAYLEVCNMSIKIQAPF